MATNTKGAVSHMVFDNPADKEYMLAWSPSPAYLATFDVGHAETILCKDLDAEIVLYKGMIEDPAQYLGPEETVEDLKRKLVDPMIAEIKRIQAEWKAWKESKQC